MKKTGYGSRSVLLGWGAIVLLMSMAGCQPKTASHPQKIVLEPVVFSDAQWTGLAVSRQGRLFVNYPRWSENVPLSVAEIVGGDPIPYPNFTMNNWHFGKDPLDYLICVQAVFVDGKDRLWILDPANPRFKGVIPGGPKLVQVDLTSNTVRRIYRFAPQIVHPDSYLNDVRIDTRREFAFITDSGNGALVVLDLQTGLARRLLDNHPSTASEGVTLVIGGSPWTFDGIVPEVHADGIAYDDQADMVYFQALTGRTMYRISGALLRNLDLPEKTIEDRIERVGRTGASDGLLFGPDGKIYISALEYDAIRRTTPDGQVETVVQDDAIAWPDSFSYGPDRFLYFTTSRIHEGGSPQAKYGIYRIGLP